MKHFFLFILALILCGTMTLDDVSKKLILPANLKVDRVANVMFGELQEVNAVEKDGIKFEILASNQILTIPANILGAYTHENVGIRITNNTSRLLQFPRYFSLEPTVMTQDGKSVRMIYPPGRIYRPNEPVCQLVKPGGSLTFLQDISIGMVNDQLQLSVGDRYSGFLVFYINPDIYRLRFTYRSDPLKQCVMVTDGMEISSKPNTWQGEIVTPFLDFRIVP